MSEKPPLWPHIPEFVPIPPIFHSLEHEGPFRACTLCGCDLAESEYFIERVFHHQEPIVEMAICSGCRDEQAQEISAESLVRIRTFLEGRLKKGDRMERLAALSDLSNLGPWLDTCLISDLPAAESPYRSIFAACYGSELMLSTGLPFMVSGQVNEELNELLSEQTRRACDDFLGTHFGMPPEFCDSPMPMLF